MLDPVALRLYGVCEHTVKATHAIHLLRSLPPKYAQSLDIEALVYAVQTGRFNAPLLLSHPLFALEKARFY